MTLKKSHKDEVRLFILRQLQEEVGLRDKLDVLAFTYEMHPFEAMEFYENEIARIEKLFNYPLPTSETLGSGYRAYFHSDIAEPLRAARRPKPLSLKDQAIAVLEDAEMDAAHYNILLRALEQLDD
jgi:hypothetical protein